MNINNYCIYTYNNRNGYTAKPFNSAVVFNPDIAKGFKKKKAHVYTNPTDVVNNMTSCIVLNVVERYNIQAQSWQYTFFL